jgi:hypothetical protein
LDRDKGKNNLANNILANLFIIKKFFLILVMLKIFSNFVFYLKNKKIQKHSKTEKI